MSLCLQVASTHYSMRSATLGAPNKRDYIEELTKELDTCQKVSFNKVTLLCLCHLTLTNIQLHSKLHSLTVRILCCVEVLI